MNKTRAHQNEYDDDADARSWAQGRQTRPAYGAVEGELHIECEWSLERVFNSSSRVVKSSRGWRQQRGIQRRLGAKLRVTC
jgi:hypothetical protein